MGPHRAKETPRLRSAARLEKHLGDIESLYILTVQVLESVFEHRQAVGARRKHVIDAEADELAHALLVDSAPERFLHPHSPAPRPTAEASPAPAIELGRGMIRRPLDKIPRLAQKALVASEIARIVVGAPEGGAPARIQPSLRNEPEQEP